MADHLAKDLEALKAQKLKKEKAAKLAQKLKEEAETLAKKEKDEAIAKKQKEEAEALAKKAKDAKIAQKLKEDAEAQVAEKKADEKTADIAEKLEDIVSPQDYTEDHDGPQHEATALAKYKKDGVYTAIDLLDDAHKNRDANTKANVTATEGNQRDQTEEKKTPEDQEVVAVTTDSDSE